MSTENMMKFCPFCGSKIFPNAKFCMEYGKELPMLNLDNSENKSENMLLNNDKKDNQQNT